MKAITYTKYGSPDVLQIKDVEKPSVKDDEVLVKIHAVSLNAYDWHFLTADIFMMRLMGVGMFKPKNTSLGADFSGRVEAVGKNVKQFKPGDEVYGDASASGNGAFAEYKCVTENVIALKPVNRSFEEAAAVPMAALTSLQGLRDEGKIEFGYDAFIGYVNRLIRNAETSPAKPPADQVKADKPAPKAKAKTDAPQEPKAEAPSIGGFNFNPKPNKEDLL